MLKPPYNKMVFTYYIVNKIDKKGFYQKEKKDLLVKYTQIAFVGNHT
jgi:hypothetical protein